MNDTIKDNRTNIINTKISACFLKPNARRRIGKYQESINET